MATEISHRYHKIECLGQNENGRTQFTTHVFQNGVFKRTIPGCEKCDSPEDYLSIERGNKHNEEARKDYLIKDFNSNQRAKNFIFTA